MRCAVATLLLLASCSHASQEYAVYEGSALRSGEGGAKTTMAGIDFWTVGSPPRKYSILGLLTDTRRDQRFSRAGFDDAVAAKVKKVGGDAVIIVDSASELAAIYRSGNIAAPISDRTTQMVVIKYEAE